jgi:hypothetical protein
MVEILIHAHSKQLRVSSAATLNMRHIAIPMPLLFGNMNYELTTSLKCLNLFTWVTLIVTHIGDRAAVE